MVRDTSREAHDNLENSGKKLSIQIRIIHLLKEATEPPTVPEMADELHLPRDSVSPRMKELIRAGCVAEVEDGVRKCTITGNNCITWELLSEDYSRSERPVARKKLLELLAAGCSVFKRTKAHMLSDAFVDWFEWYDEAVKVLKAEKHK